jgi:hypothetical protein
VRIFPPASFVGYLDILLIARDLSAICNSSAHMHALACLCFRDNVVRYWDEMRADDMENLYGIWK